MARASPRRGRLHPIAVDRAHCHGGAYRALEATGVGIFACLRRCITDCASDRGLCGALYICPADGSKLGFRTAIAGANRLPLAVEFAKRGRIFDEWLQIVTRLWAGEEVNFEDSILR